MQGINSLNTKKKHQYIVRKNAGGILKIKKNKWI